MPMQATTRYDWSRDREVIAAEMEKLKAASPRAKDWELLLKRCPNCAVYCPTLGWLNGDQWTQILLKVPALAEKCNWSCLGGKNWAKILQKGLLSCAYGQGHVILPYSMGVK